jgi:hypothetical protein
MPNYAQSRVGFQEYLNNLNAPTTRLLATDDLNGDGLKDLVLVDLTYTPSGQPPISVPLRIALAVPTGGFVEIRDIFSTSAQNAYQDPYVVIDDFTGDGLSDVVVYDAGYYDWSGGRVTRGGIPDLWVGTLSGSLVYSSALSDALTSFVRPQGDNYRGGYQIDLTMGVKDITAADIDQDGDIDLWIESTGSANMTSHFVVNNGNGTFSVDFDHRLDNAFFFGPNSWANLGTGTDYYRYGSGVFLDANGDAAPDLLLGQIRDNDISHIGQSSFLMINDGTGYFSAARAVRLSLPDFYYGYTSVQDAKAFDVNGDGLQDLVLIHTRNDDVSGPLVETAWRGTYIQVLLQNAQGEYVDRTDDMLGDQSAWSSQSANAYAQLITPFDINHDGRMDFVLSYRGERPSDSAPVLFMSKGDHFVVGDRFYLTGGDSYFGEGMRPVDVDGDGKLDFVHLDAAYGPNGRYDGVLSDDYSTIVYQHALISNSTYLMAEPFAGPAELNLTYQLIDFSDSAVVIGSSSNEFIKLAGTGNKAVSGGGGNDVIDGGTGSTFVSGGGASTDACTFFLDGRAPGVSWSTITDFDLGYDRATIWGWTPGVSQVNATFTDFNTGGAPGYTGLTLHFNHLLPDDHSPNARNPDLNSITLSGCSLADFGATSLAELNTQITTRANSHFVVGSTVDQFGEHGYLYIS